MKLSSFLPPLRLLPVLAAALLTIAPNTAPAAVSVYDLTYSGASFGNTAVATGKISIDTALLANPGFNYDSLVSLGVTDLSLTVSGATSGNGTFSLADYSYMVWSTDGRTLDLTTQLVGQGTWGTDSGDFNLFNNSSNPNAPTGFGPFILAMDAGSGDWMQLTSFAPSVAVAPEPSRALLLAAGLTGMMLRRRRK